MSGRAAGGKTADAPEDAPRPDCVDGAPHPRETPALMGQERAEAAFLEAWGARRLHHAWLLRGPRGVGKATLAYRIARAVLAAPADAPAPATLDVAPDHPVARRIAAGAEPRLRALIRPLKRKSGSREFERPLRRVREILVEEVRGLGDFLHLSAADGGWRVVIVDAADELNVSAANAFLKLLEEPPPRVLMLLVAHAPARLAPTIRSRCRTLDCAPLAPEPFAAALAQAGAKTEAKQAKALAELSGGAPGDALELAAGDGAALYAEMAALAAGAPGLDRPRLRALCAACGGRDAAARYALTARLTTTLLERLARAGAGLASPEAAPGEAALAARLAPDAARARLWAETASDIAARAARAQAVNLDPERTILDIWLRVDAAAAKAVGARGAQRRLAAPSPP